MSAKTNKLLKNQNLGVSVRVTNERLHVAGVTLAKDLGVVNRRLNDSSLQLPKPVIRRLVGG